jgi:hypothetical protein
MVSGESGTGNGGERAKDRPSFSLEGARYFAALRFAGAFVGTLAGDEPSARKDFDRTE